MTDKEKELFPEEEGNGEEVAAGPEQPEAESRPGPETDEVGRLKTRMAYLAAEFDNYRKRTAREREAIVAFGNERLLAAILPFLDNLERAISQSEAAGSAGALLSGVRMTYEQLLADLRKFGLEQVEAVGKPFDPNLHEAVGVVSSEGEPEGTVLAESRKGYVLNGRLLRPAQVTVAAGGAQASPDAGEAAAPDTSGAEN
jgi:molecular chaperone GrpE